MITAILIDDEYYALEGLKQDLEDLGTVRVLGTYENGRDALAAAADLRPELIFLDIEMPEMNGLELFDQLLEASPQTAIVFVTAYNQYAIHAFDLNAMDYLLKPVLPERLEKTLQRLEKKSPGAIKKQLSLHCFGQFFHSGRRCGSGCSLAYQKSRGITGLSGLCQRPVCLQGETGRNTLAGAVTGKKQGQFLSDLSLFKETTD